MTACNKLDLNRGGSLALHIAQWKIRCVNKKYLVVANQISMQC